MPRPFRECVRAGGRVRTMKRGQGKFQKICFPKGRRAGGRKPRAKLGHVETRKG